MNKRQVLISFGVDTPIVHFIAGSKSFFNAASSRWIASLIGHG
jgi:hypothetical protein